MTLDLCIEQFTMTSCNNELYKRGSVTVRELLKARENISGIVLPGKLSRWCTDSITPGIKL